MPGRDASFVTVPIFPVRRHSSDGMPGGVVRTALARTAIPRVTPIRKLHFNLMIPLPRAGLLDARRVASKTRRLRA
jgi:hypothetical protein